MTWDFFFGVMAEEVGRASVLGSIGAFFHGHLGLDIQATRAARLMPFETFPLPMMRSNSMVFSSTLTVVLLTGPIAGSTRGPGFFIHQLYVQINLEIFD